MRKLILVASIVCLIANLIPSILFLLGRMELTTVHNAMIWTTIAWYVVAALLIYGKHTAPMGDLDADRELFLP